LFDFFLSAWKQSIVAGVAQPIVCSVFKQAKPQATALGNTSMHRFRVPAFLIYKS
jgi:hypothetical protein